MKIINKTKIKTELLHQVIIAAKNSLRKQIATNIVIYIGQGKKATISFPGAKAHKCSFVNGKWNPEHPDKWIITNGGCITLTLPVTLRGGLIECVKWFYKCAAHEWGHIYDFQQQNKGRHLEFAHKINNKRGKHDYRPEEKRVYEYLAKSNFTPESEADLLLKLAIEIETLYYDQD
jgi:hypothetical protein